MDSEGVIFSTAWTFCRWNLDNSGREMDIAGVFSTAWTLRVEPGRAEVCAALSLRCSDTCRATAHLGSTVLSATDHVQKSLEKLFVGQSMWWLPGLRVAMGSV